MLVIDKVDVYTELVDKWRHRIHRLSVNQLKALEVLAVSKNGIVEAMDSSDGLGLKGKALGGVFSSLSRQVISGQHLIEAWGRGLEGRGLRWKLNTEAITQSELKKTVEEVLG